MARARKAGRSGSPFHHAGPPATRDLMVAALRPAGALGGMLVLIGFLLTVGLAAAPAGLPEAEDPGGIVPGTLRAPLAGRSERAATHRGGPGTGMDHAQASWIAWESDPRQALQEMSASLRRKNLPRANRAEVVAPPP